jgi:hypothetical protein
MLARCCVPVRAARVALAAFSSALRTFSSAPPQAPLEAAPRSDEEGPQSGVASPAAGPPKQAGLSFIDRVKVAGANALLGE